MRPRQMNPRQRQGLLLVVLSAVALLGVFALIASYVSGVSKQVGPKTTVLELVHPLSAYQQVSTDDLKEVSVPRKWAPPLALSDPTEAVGMVSKSALSAPTWLQQNMLTERPALPPGDREIAVTVDPESGVAGQVSPGDLVDIIATYAGTEQSNGSTSRNVAEVVVAGAQVLDAGQLNTAAANDDSSGVPVTLALTPAQVLKVKYAESFGEGGKVSLSIVAPGSRTSTVTPHPYSAQQ